MSRGALALLLTFLSVAAPCTAWYFTGSRGAAREAEHVEEAPRLRATAMAEAMATDLGLALEALRIVENDRPFDHYQSLYHEPRGAYAGESVIPSPLSAGPANPLVTAHFQIDESASLTLPTINDVVPEVNATRDLEGQRRIRSLLEPRITDCLTAILEEGPARKVARGKRPPSPQQIQSALSEQEIAQVFDQTVMPSEYRQSRQANKVFKDLRSGRRRPAGDANPQGPGSQGVDDKNNAISLSAGAFQWRTIALGDEPTLVALRQVRTPDGVLVQGFVVSRSDMQKRLESVSTEGMPVTVGRISNDSPGAVVRIPIPEGDWAVLVDSSEPEARAAARASEIRTGFRVVFGIGSLAAALGGLFVVSLVWKAEHLARQRSRFAAAAAHELRTPLAGLRMYGEMLAEGLGDPEKAPRYARRVADEAERLGRVVSNVLGFTRLERGGVTVQPTPGDLGATVLDCVAKLRPALEATGLELMVDVVDDLPEMVFDRDAVFQICQNLIDNAEKYSRTSAARRVELTVSALGGVDEGAVIRVRDHGPGVPAELRSRLFEPFARGDSDDAPAGLGLGLALAASLAKAHGGSVRCDNATDGGAIFEVFLP